MSKQLAMLQVTVGKLHIVPSPSTLQLEQQS